MKTPKHEHTCVVEYVHPFVHCSLGEWDRNWGFGGEAKKLNNAQRRGELSVVVLIYAVELVITMLRLMRHPELDDAKEEVDLDLFYPSDDKVTKTPKKSGPAQTPSLEDIEKQKEMKEMAARIHDFEQEALKRKADSALSSNKSRKRKKNNKQSEKLLVSTPEPSGSEDNADGAWNPEPQSTNPHFTHLSVSDDGEHMDVDNSATDPAPNDIPQAAPEPDFLVVGAVDWDPTRDLPANYVTEVIFDPANNEQVGDLADLMRKHEEQTFSRVMVHMRLVMLEMNGTFPPAPEDNADQVLVNKRLSDVAEHIAVLVRSFLFLLDELRDIRDASLLIPCLIFESLQVTETPWFIACVQYVAKQECLRQGPDWRPKFIVSGRENKFNDVCRCPFLL
jgi:hypothetical protein